jgi:uncharacterized protein (UPF0147 family)
MNIHTLNDIPPWEWPENAGEFISKVLRDKDTPESDRVLAAELAGENVVMNDNLGNLLLTIIQDNDEPEELRAKAAISLGPALDYGNMMEFDDPDDIVLSEGVFHKVQAQLQDIYQDANSPKTLRRRVLEASVRAPMDWHKQAIQEAYRSNDQEWLLTAVFCMAYVKGFEDQILESLESKNPEIFYEAVRAAGNWGVKEAWPYVKEIITGEDVDKPLLIAAIDACIHINSHESVDILSELSLSDDEEIAEAAEEALSMAGMYADDLSDYDDLPEDDSF